MLRDRAPLAARRSIDAVDPRPAVLRTIELADGIGPPALLGLLPRVAVAGLNPHAGEGGFLGDEDERHRPRSGRAGRARVSGPLSADTVFRRAARKAHEGVVALYHDQATSR